MCEWAKCAQAIVLCGGGGGRSCFPPTPSLAFCPHLWVKCGLTLLPVLVTCYYCIRRYGWRFPILPRSGGARDAPVAARRRLIASMLHLCIFLLRKSKGQTQQYHHRPNSLLLEAKIVIPRLIRAFRSSVCALEQKRMASAARPFSLFGVRALALPSPRNPSKQGPSHERGCLPSTRSQPLRAPGCGGVEKMGRTHGFYAIAPLPSGSCLASCLKQVPCSSSDFSLSNRDSSPQSKWEWETS